MICSATPGAAALRSASICRIAADTLPPCVLTSMFRFEPATGIGPPYPPDPPRLGTRRRRREDLAPRVVDGGDRVAVQLERRGHAPRVEIPFEHAGVDQDDAAAEP